MLEVKSGKKWTEQKALSSSGWLRWLIITRGALIETVYIFILEFSMESADMRAPLAVLTVLWYHTIMKPFFTNTGELSADELIETVQLIDKYQTQYPDSSLFLFFKGRVCRLEKDLDGALSQYEKAQVVSPPFPGDFTAVPWYTSVLGTDPHFCHFLFFRTLFLVWAYWSLRWVSILPSESIVPFLGFFVVDWISMSPESVNPAILVTSKLLKLVTSYSITELVT